MSEEKIISTTAKNYILWVPGEKTCRKVPKRESDLKIGRMLGIEYEVLSELQGSRYIPEI